MRTSSNPIARQDAEPARAAVRAHLSNRRERRHRLHELIEVEQD